MTELKPCPFCGGEATIFDHDHAYWATCLKCEAEIMMQGSYLEAIEAWNRRANDDLQRECDNHME